MQDTQAFAPFYKVSRPDASQAGTLMPSVTVAATAGGGNASAAMPPANSGGSAVQIANQATVWAYVNFGVFGNVTAATVASSYPVAPGSVVAVSVDQEVTGASVILASSTGNVIFTRGNGV